ncbi:CvpA family protein [Sphingomonas sp. TDK1]|uniref:CvpA family protein n=1 Tax=Sphingomonas sp. TDK1 TaxID=453247 RepID=UPI0007D8E637|nr:CvpA family protein [Sphingomonas sp. TDK1]OAN67204.1 colicin V production protein [Sphingomonas sp. TDK1]
MTGLDIVTLLIIAGAAILGFLRGFTTEVLAFLAWILVVVAVKFFHAGFTALLAPMIGTEGGAAVLAFAVLAGLSYFGGRLIANTLGGQMRNSMLGPIDRALGVGFGVAKGLILVSMGFLVMMLVLDTFEGGRTHRPKWITRSVTYPLLDTTSAAIADFVDRRRKGEPVFGDDNGSTDAAEPEDAHPRRRKAD